MSLTAVQFDSDADACTRFLSDATQALSERDQLKRSGQATADAGGRIRGAISKAEKQLEKINAALKLADTAGSNLCVYHQLSRSTGFARANANECLRKRSLTPPPRRRPHQHLPLITAEARRSCSGDVMWSENSRRK